MYIISIEEPSDPGSPYRLLAVDSQDVVETLERAAHRANLEAVVRNADTVSGTLHWLREMTPQKEGAPE